jgi:hypothetical protein
MGNTKNKPREHVHLELVLFLHGRALFIRLLRLRKINRVFLGQQTEKPSPFEVITQFRSVVTGGIERPPGPITTREFDISGFRDQVNETNLPPDHDLA